jgi:N-acetylmuramic acid 6-phosphate etherase
VERSVTEQRPTEARNARARGLESFTTRQILELMNDEDATVPAAVRAALPALERAVDEIVTAFRAGHRHR